MMKIVLVALLLLPMVCFAEEITKNQISPLTSESTIPTASKESVNEILAKVEHLGPVQYTQIFTYSVISKSKVANPTITTYKIWYKEPFIKIEYTAQPGGEIREVIKYPDVAYLRILQERNPRDQYYKTANTSDPKTFKEIAKEIRDNSSLQILGSETIDGKTTTLMQIDVPFGLVVAKHKFWIWNENGIPLKIEYRTEMKDYVLVLLFENKDFVFGDIADSVFEVPKDNVIELTPPTIY